MTLARNIKIAVFGSGVFAVLLAPLACRLSIGSAAPPDSQGLARKTKRLVPLPNKPQEPKNNPSTPEKIELGKQLFFDPRLSGDNTMSCATCHQPDKAWGDGRARAKGAGGKRLARNTPSLLNVGFRSALFWDGRAGSLEEQALIPIQAADEMNQPLDKLEEELNAVPGYVKQFQQVFAAAVTRQGVAKAIAAFERTLVTRDSPLDRYLAGDKKALSEEAREGLELFTGDAGCIRCHHGPLLSDGKFHRIGVSFQDRGRGALTGKKQDDYKFLTPSLRDVARTGPYMHDGSLDSLYYVTIHYLKSVPTSGPGGIALDVEAQLGLSFSDVERFTAFFKSLSGTPPKVKPPKLP